MVQVLHMAHRLKLPENFKVTTFGSSCKMSDLGKYLPRAPIGVNVVGTLIRDDVVCIGNVTYTSNIRLL